VRRVDESRTKFSAPNYTHDVAEMVAKVFREEASMAGDRAFLECGTGSWQEIRRNGALDCLPQRRPATQSENGWRRLGKLEI